MRTTKNLVICVLLGVVVVFMVGAWSSSNEVGRYDIKFGTFPTTFVGPDAKPITEYTPICLKIDTATGQVWEAVQIDTMQGPTIRSVRHFIDFEYKKSMDVSKSSPQ